MSLFSKGKYSHHFNWVSKTCQDDNNFSIANGYICQKEKKKKMEEMVPQGKGTFSKTQFY